MEKNRKRRGYFRQNEKVKQKWVEPDISGLLFTCNGNEKQAVREAYNVIEQALEKWNSGDESNSGVNAGNSGSNDEEEDVADSVKRFCDQARSDGSDNAKMKRKIYQQRTGANNCLFFIVNDVKSEKIYDFVDFLIEMIHKERCCRLLQRVWPIEKTCRMDMVELDMEISRLIARHFHPDENGKWPTYSVEFKSRNNDSLRKSDAMDMVLLALKQLAPASRVSLDDPEIAVLVQVVHKCVMLSCIKRFHARRKLSLHRKE